MRTRRRWPSVTKGGGEGLELRFGWNPSDDDNYRGIDRAAAADDKNEER